MEAGRDGGREGGMDGGREGWRQGGRDGGREGWRQGGRDGGRDGRMEAGRDGGREGGRDEGREGWRQGGNEGEAGRDGGREGWRQGGNEGEAGGRFNIFLSLKNTFSFFFSRVNFVNNVLLVTHDKPQVVGHTPCACRVTVTVTRWGASPVTPRLVCVTVETTQQEEPAKYVKTVTTEMPHEEHLVWK